MVHHVECCRWLGKCEKERTVYCVMQCCLYNAWGDFC